MTYGRILAGLALAAVGAAPAAAGDAPGVGDAPWLAPDADIVRYLTTAPGECAIRPKDEDARFLLEVGRAAFKSPLLFGGTAARSGLSCNTCHPDGRRNADFFLSGLSRAPGDADVTSSLFSRTREDGIDNPQPIPDLVDAEKRASAAMHGDGERLAEFIVGAVRDEFQGTPPARVIDGLIAYVASFDASVCPDAPRRVTERSDVADAARAFDAADAALARGEAETADFLLLAAQGALGRVAERFDGAENADERAMIEALARKIAGARAIAAQSPKGARARLEEARLDAKRLGWRLRARRDRSLYDAERISERLSGG